MSAASGVEKVHRFTKGAQLTVRGQAHLVDFTGDTDVAHDPDVLRRYLAGEVATCWSGRTRATAWARRSARSPG